jgi:hypothetical protein
MLAGEKGKFGHVNDQERMKGGVDRKGRAHAQLSREVGLSYFFRKCSFCMFKPHNGVFFFSPVARQTQSISSEGSYFINGVFLPQNSIPRIPQMEPKLYIYKNEFALSFRILLKL